MSNGIKQFNVRVYGLIVNENRELLLADEYQMNMKMTKFPGGGLQFGEGTIDCLKREALEEFGQKIEVLDHFYTLDYFQPSMFNKDYQLLSIYYKARFPEPVQFKVSSRPFDFSELNNGNISFRWKALDIISSDDMTLPVDKMVAGMLRENA
ncbi:MAG: NUDIX domain-containing protein [Bacteroidales bacterium]|nr:NUDIX domain-containing protein [Bacteroidales bacterium]MBS3775094.1 NUDIX domain-containing protein [Bacteroidales bacterium]